MSADSITAVPCWGPNGWVEDEPRPLPDPQYATVTVSGRVTCPMLVGERCVLNLNAKERREAQTERNEGKDTYYFDKGEPCIHVVSRGGLQLA